MKRREFIQLSSFVYLSPINWSISNWRNNATSLKYTDNIIIIIHLRGGLDWAMSLTPYAQQAILEKLRPHLNGGVKNINKLNRIEYFSKQIIVHCDFIDMLNLYQLGNLHILLNTGYKKQVLTHFEAEQLISHNFEKEVISMESQQKFGHPYYLAIGSKSLKLLPETVDLRDISPTEESQYYPPIVKLEDISLAQNYHKKWVDVFEKTLTKGNNLVTYPSTGFAKDLKTVAQLIQGGCTTPVYHITLNGFDTHQNQAEQYSHLLKTFNDGIFAFQQDLNKSGQAKRVLTVAFSEFGRSVKENIWGGTEHGNHQTLMFFGENIGGVTGTHPDLSDLDDAGLIAKPPMFDLIDTLKNVTTNWLTEGVFSIESRNRGTSL